MAAVAILANEDWENKSLGGGHGADSQVSFGVSLLALPAIRAKVPASQFTPAAILPQEKLRGCLLLDWRTMAGVVTKSTLKKYCAPLLSRRLVVF
jgi:hypothetical protein